MTICATPGKWFVDFLWMSPELPSLVLILILLSARILNRQ